MSNDSTEPLIDLDIEELREEARKIVPPEEQKFLQFENRPWYMCFYHIFMSLVTGATIAGAYFFLISGGDKITPRCYVYHDYHEKSFIPDSPDSETWNEWLCNITTICFWTYPLVCPMVVICVYLKNLLDARLYYECLLNGILLDYRNASHLASPAFWLLLLHGCLGISCLFYIKSASQWSDRSLSEMASSFLAYLAPVFAFLFVLFSNWSVEWHLIPISKYCEQDHTEAISHLGKCTFATDRELENAWEATEELLIHRAAANGRKIQLSTPEFFTLVRQQLIRKTRCPDRGCCSCLRFYWVYRLLCLSSKLYDKRVASFRCWVRVYWLFIALAGTVFLWAFIHTAHFLLIYQQVLSTPLPLGPDPHSLKKSATSLIQLVLPLHAFQR